MSRFGLMSAALFLASSLFGCGDSGPATYPVTGTVTLDGEPIPEGQIAFRDPEGQIVSAGGKITDGEYDFQSQPGTMEVKITARRALPEEFWSPAPGVKIPATEQYIPAQYNEESELTKDVTEGENTFKFELTSK